jgi:hypothetical protein
MEKRKRHKWENIGEQCNNCGYYEEYCRNEGCYATRLMNGQGKEIARDE